MIFNFKYLLRRVTKKITYGTLLRSSSNNIYTTTGKRLIRYIHNTIHSIPFHSTPHLITQQLLVQTKKSVSQTILLLSSLARRCCCHHIIHLQRFIFLFGIFSPIKLTSPNFSLFSWLAIVIYLSFIL